MDISQLQRVIVDALEDVKAQDIRVFSTTHLTGLFDRVVVASGTSNRQTKALASNVREKVKEAGGDIISTEGEETGEWVLVDCGDAVVHIMQPALRQYYNLEEIWGDKPVKIKLSASGPMTARYAEETAEASGPMTAPLRRRNRRTADTAKPVAKAKAKAPVRKVASKKTAGNAAVKTAREAGRQTRRSGHQGRRQSARGEATRGPSPLLRNRRRRNLLQSVHRLARPHPQHKPRRQASLATGSLPVRPPAYPPRHSRLRRYPSR